MEPESELGEDFLSADEEEKEEKIKPLELFKRKARVVRALCSVSLAFSKCAREAGVETHGIDGAVVQGPTRAQFYSEEDGFLEFDMSDFTFRSDNEYRWPKYAKDAVLKVPSARTSEDVEQIMGLLKQVKLFRRQPEETQRLLASQVYYMKLDRGRDVLREGHPGYSYYFIFSGEVRVSFSSSLDADPVFLRKGDGFGERAILFECERNATVTTNSQSEFLLVFDDCFWESGYGNFYLDQFKRAETFLRSLPIFSSLSTDVLRLLAENAFVSDHLDGAVIVKDSVKSECVWFVLGGAADVFRHMRKKRKKLESPDERKTLWLAEKDGKLPKMSPCGNSARSYQNFISHVFDQDSMMKVDHLNTGRSFGLSSVFDKSRSFSLVSRGAEVISISKNVLLKHISSGHLEATLELYEKLPSDKKISRSCVQESGWVMYRRKEMRSTIHRLNDLSHRFEKTQKLFKSPASTSRETPRKVWQD